MKYLYRQKTLLLSVSLGIVYLWFGALKFISGLSPAEELATRTIENLTFGLIPASISIVLLALWETVVGGMLLLNIRKKFVIGLALLHMVCTFTPLLFFPDLSFSGAPFGLTLVGQYIIKNFVIIAALISIYPMNTEDEKKLSF